MGREWDLSTVRIVSGLVACSSRDVWGRRLRLGTLGHEERAKQEVPVKCARSLPPMVAGRFAPNTESQKWPLLTRWLRVLIHKLQCRRATPCVRLTSLAPIEITARPYGVARMIVGATAAEDVTQEVFVDFWRRPECFDPARGSLRTFLLTVAHHRAVDVVETARSVRQRRVGNDPLLNTDHSDLGLHGLANTEMIAAALNELATDVRQAIVTAYFGGLTYQEVPIVLGESEGTIKSRIRRGLTQLRPILQRPEYGYGAEQGAGHTHPVEARNG